MGLQRKVKKRVDDRVFVGQVTLTIETSSLYAFSVDDAVKEGVLKALHYTQYNTYEIISSSPVSLKGGDHGVFLAVNAYL